MENKTELFIGLRKKNGQIGYLSEGVKVPEFFDLVLSKENEKPVLIDFSPVIEKLHHLHCKQNDESIRNKYNSLYNYWQDARTYTKEPIRLSKSEQLSSASNDLINELQTRIQEKSNQFYISQNDKHTLVNSIKQDSNMYIDILLCFIHSKASLEVESFKFDSVLRSYCDFLEDTIRTLFYSVIEQGRDRESFFKYLAFEKKGELQTYLNLVSPTETESQFLLRTIKNSKPTEVYDQIYGYSRVVSFSYDNFNHQYTEMANTLRDLMYKIKSISKLLSLLKEEDIGWSSNDGAESLLALLES
jgi:hypothetical protein